MENRRMLRGYTFFEGRLISCIKKAIVFSDNGFLVKWQKWLFANYHHFAECSCSIVNRIGIHTSSQ